MKPKINTLTIETKAMQWLDIRQNIVVPNVSWGIYQQGSGVLHECDLLSLSKSGYATEVEIKISKSDLLKDKDKKHNHNNSLIKYLYFAVPLKLKDIALKSIPLNSGLLVVDYKYYDYYERWELYVDVIKKPVKNPNTIKWDEHNQYQLLRLGCMRILGLKQKLLRQLNLK